MDLFNRKFCYTSLLHLKLHVPVTNKCLFPERSLCSNEKVSTFIVTQKVLETLESRSKFKKGRSWGEVKSHEVPCDPVRVIASTGEIPTLGMTGRVRVVTEPRPVKTEEIRSKGALPFDPGYHRPSLRNQGSCPWQR